MSVRFNWDEAGLRNALNAAATEGVAEMGRQVQDVFDAVYAEHANQERADVREALDAAAQRAELNFTAEQLDAYAEAIAEGRRIIVETSVDLPE